MKNLSLIPWLLLLGSVVVGCLISGDSQAQAGETVPRAHLLESATWVVQDVRGADGNPVEGFATANRPLTLRFAAGRLVVGGGCNAASGSYRVVEGKLIVGPMASTMMACADSALMDQDQRVGSALAVPLALTLDEDPVRLTLQAAGGQTFVFAPHTAKAP